MSSISKATLSKRTLNLKGQLHIIETPLIMGILNITPDSFFDGGRYNSLEESLKQAEQMIQEGADILDIGGYSSRPNADNISTEEELIRVTPVIKAIREKFKDIIISIDTFRAEVAKKAVEAGADIINDISGGTLDNQMLEVAAQLNVPYIMMHIKGSPQNMQKNTDYKDLIGDIMDFFVKQSKKFYQLGGKDLILDVGFGFAKTVEQNHELLNNLDEFKLLELPLLVGVSRKSMIYKKLNISPSDALNGTTVLNTIALSKGADILRVHDVKEAKQIIELLG